MQDIPHAGKISRRIIISGQRDHAQAETDADIQGQTLRFEDDADGSKGYIAVGSHKAVQDDIIEIKEKGSHGSRKPYSEKRGKKAQIRQSLAQRKVEDRIVEPLDQEQKIHAGDRVAEGGGNAGPQDLVARRQQDKHEDWIQNNVEDAAQGNKEPRLL